MGISSPEHDCLDYLPSTLLHIPAFHDSLVSHDPHSQMLVGKFRIKPIKLWLLLKVFKRLRFLHMSQISAITGTPLPEEYPEDGETLVLDDDEEEGQGDGEEKKMSLRQKLQAVQDATQTLQNALGDIASICESTRK